jgi:hypothetical protein
MADTKKILNELNRLYFDSIDGAKNNVMQVIANAVANGSLKVERELLPKLLAFIATAIDDSKMQMFRGYEKTSRKIVESISK